MSLEKQDAEYKSIDTERASVSQSFSRAFGERSPHTPRGPEGPPHLALREWEQTNPVLSESDVTDVTSPDGVADPFVIYDPDRAVWDWFFEVLESNNLQIGHATAEDLVTPTYNQIVLDSSEGNSWPMPQRLGGVVHMYPSNPNNNFEIWTPDTYPTDWSRSETAVNFGFSANDPAPFFFNKRWWLLVRDDDGSQVRLYQEDSGLGRNKITGGSWSEHTSSPVYTSTAKERLAGRPVVLDNSVLVPLQNRDADSIDMDVVSELDTSTFTTTSVGYNPIAARTGSESDTRWNSSVVHHVEFVVNHLGNTIALVDGQPASTEWKVGVYTPTAAPRNHHTAILISDQTGVADVTSTPVEFDSREYDYNLAWDLANNKLVIPNDGVWRATARVSFDSLPDGTFYQASLLADSVELDRDNRTMGAQRNDDQSLYLSREKYLAAGTEITVEVQHNSGGDETLSGASTGRPTRCSVTQL